MTETKAMDDDLAQQNTHTDRTFCRSMLFAFPLLFFTVGFLDAARADESLLPYAMSVPREGEGDTLRFAAFQVERYDSNFFRLPDGVNPNGNQLRSTVTSTTGLGVGLDKRYGLQRFVADAAVTYDHYAPYTKLDFTGYRLTSTYYWAITPALTGNLVFDHARLPTNYEFTSFRTATNPRTTQNTRLDIDWRAGAALHPRLSLFATEDTTQDPTFQVESYKARNAQLALVYQFRSNNNAQVYLRGTRGNNTNADQPPSFLINNDFTESEAGFLTQWTVSGLTTGEASIGRLQRNYSTFNQRSFDGVVGHLNLTYNVTGKTTARLAASRTLNSSQTIFSSYYTEDIGRASLEWAATGKITVRPVFQLRRQVYKGSPFPVVANLSETTRDTSLQVDLAALRALDFSFALTRSTRNANDPTLQFVDHSASVSARIKF